MNHQRGECPAGGPCFKQTWHMKTLIQLAGRDGQLLGLDLALGALRATSGPNNNISGSHVLLT